MLDSHHVMCVGNIICTPFRVKVSVIVTASVITKTDANVVKEIPCGRFRGHISYSIDLKIGQNVCLDEILVDFQLGSLGHKLGHYY